MEPIYLSIKQKETGNRILKKSSSLTGISSWKGKDRYL